jgi:predicted nucleic acid-binding protein
MYVDSAVFVKLVVREADSLFYADLLENQGFIRSSELAVVECRSVLLRKMREGQLDEKTREHAWVRLQNLWKGGGVKLIPVSGSVLAGAGHALQSCGARIPLRTLDAIHLATALECNAFPLITNDRVMRAAAGHLRIPLGPELKP